MAVNKDSLLDKLYNLRGSDSEILKEMDSQKSAAEQTKNRTTEEKAKLQSEIAELKNRKEELASQGEQLKTLLQGINRQDYATVLDSLDIDFNPSEILEKITSNLPKTIDNVEKDTKASELELVSVEKEMNAAITTIDEIGIRRDTALANQAKLNEYFDMALKGHINITRDSITTLLQEFGFNEEEQREAAKLLMFPEDGLFEYNESTKHYKRKPEPVAEEEIISFEEPKVEESNIEEEKDEPVAIVEPVIPEEEIKVLDPEKEVEESTSPVEEEKSKTEIVETNKDEVIDFLNKNNIDYLDYTADELEDLIVHFNPNVVQKNIDYMKNNDIDMDIFVNHMKMMYDEELESKMELLLNVGKEPLDIYLNPSVLAKYSYEELNNSIERIKANGMDPKEIPLMAY